MNFTTATGTTFPYKWCGVTFNGVLVISMPNTTNVSDIFALSMNQAALASLTFVPDEATPDSNKVLTGYTRFVGIQINEGESAINLMLGKEYSE